MNGHEPGPKPPEAGPPTPEMGLTTTKTVASSAHSTTASSVPSSAETSRSMKIIVALLPALSSVVGAVLGTTFTFSYELRKWRQETAYTYELAVLNKRVELIERTIRVVNKSLTAERLSLTMESTSRIAQATVASEIIHKRRDSKFDFNKYMQNYLASALQFDDLRTEFASVLSLDNLYFGPKTRTAIKDFEKFQPDWWKADDTTKKALIDAVADELSLGLRNFGKTLSEQ